MLRVGPRGIISYSPTNLSWPVSLTQNDGYKIGGETIKYWAYMILSILLVYFGLGFLASAMNKKKI